MRTDGPRACRLRERPGRRHRVWHGKGVIEEAIEVPLLIKTRAGRNDELEVAVRDLRPYELPELLTVQRATSVSG